MNENNEFSGGRPWVQAFTLAAKFAKIARDRAEKVKAAALAEGREYQEPPLRSLDHRCEMKDNTIICIYLKDQKDLSQHEIDRLAAEVEDEHSEAWCALFSAAWKEHERRKLARDQLTAEASNGEDPSS